MKRSFCLILSVVLCVALLFPVTTHAQTDPVLSTDMHISIDSFVWTVYTRVVAFGDFGIGEPEIPHEKIYNFLKENNLYLYASKSDPGGEHTEFLIRKTPIDTGLANLSNYKNRQVLSLARELARKNGIEAYSIYTSQYKFVKLEYYDADAALYLCKFITIVNKDNYTFTFQSSAPFTEQEHIEIQKIMDSVAFDIDPSIQEDSVLLFLDNAPELATIGTVIISVGSVLIGTMIGVIILIVRKKKKKSCTTDSE